MKTIFFIQKIVLCLQKLDVTKNIYPRKALLYLGSLMLLTVALCGCIDWGPTPARNFKKYIYHSVELLDEKYCAAYLEYEDNLNTPVIVYDLQARLKVYFPIPFFYYHEGEWKLGDLENPRSTVSKMSNSVPQSGEIYYCTPDSTFHLLGKLEDPEQAYEDKETMKRELSKLLKDSAEKIHSFYPSETAESEG